MTCFGLDSSSEDVVSAAPPPVTVVRITSSTHRLLFTLQDATLLSGHFTRSGGAILGKPDQKAVYGAHRGICLPDVRIVLVNLFMNLVYHNGLSSVRLRERLRDNFPLNWAK